MSAGVCPKCGAANGEGASFCGVCYVPFTAKAPGAAPAPPPPALAERHVFRSGRVECEGWVYAGPLLFDAQGLCVFVGTRAYEGPLWRRALALALGQAGGAAGGAAVDAAAGNEASGRRGPAAVALRHRAELGARYEPALAFAPDITGCSLAFTIERERLESAAVYPDGAELKVGGAALELRGEGDWTGLARSLAAWKYPVSAAAPASGRRRAYLLGAALAAAAGFAALKDVQELGQANAKLARHTGVQGIVLSPDGARYIVDGKELRAKDVPWAKRLPLYNYGVLVGLLAAGAYGVTALRRYR